MLEFRIDQYDGCYQYEEDEIDFYHEIHFSWYYPEGGGDEISDTSDDADDLYIRCWWLYWRMIELQKKYFNDQRN